MLKLMRKLMTGLLAMLLLTGLMNCAMAESETTLQLTFIGMYANSDGTYAARNLPGEFEVYQNGQKVCTVTSDENGSEMITLPGSGNVQLMPVAGTTPEEIPVNVNGYVVSVVQGQFNIAPVVVFARAGLFHVHTESVASFALLNERGDTVMRFSTDSKGDYRLPTAIPAGLYTLRMEEASLAISKWRDKIINLLPYDGPDSLLYVDASYYFYPEVTLKPATPTPEVEITATPAPTASATPTTEPTGSLETAAPAVTVEATHEATATPTTVPTATPTASPVPTDGTLVLAVFGDQATARYKVSAAGTLYAEGDLIPGTSARVPDLHMGRYIVTVDMPEDVMLTGLNGYVSHQRVSAQWLATVTGGGTSVYEIELSKTGSISGTISGVDANVPITISGGELYNITGNGSYAQDGMLPDTYSVTIVLPMGSYEGEGWSFVDSVGQTLAICRVVVPDGGDVVLPAITATVLGHMESSVKAAADQGEGGGQVVVPGKDEQSAPTMESDASLLVQVFVDANNNGVIGRNEPYLAGVTVSLIADGRNVDTAVTDGEGMARLYAPEGEYTLRCEMPSDYGYAKKGSKDLITNSAMDLSVDRVQELAGVQLVADTETVLGIGAAQMAALQGTVWHDANYDGLWQPDEPGIEGMRITANGTKNGLVYETFTDAEGHFEIRQIRHGTYNVVYEVPEGYVFTYKASGQKQMRSLMTTEADRKGSDQIIFEAGETVDEQNIGLVTEAVVEGYCFLDANYNGYYDEGEQPLPGVEIELFRQSNNKRLKTTVSDENGYFRFGNVRGDTFKLKALLPKNMAYTINVPGDMTANQFVPRDNRREQSITGLPGVCGESVNVVLGAISFGSVSGVVYQDDNFSGEWEMGEKIAAGLIVSILDEDGRTVKSTKTNKSGSYTFGELTPGNYRLAMTARTGFAFTCTGEGNVMLNMGDGKGESELFAVELGAELTGVDIGMIVPAVVKGLAFADANDNGLYDAGEKGLTGTVVTLMTQDGAVSEMQVAADGAFEFDSVLPGRYYLRYELPENGVFSPRVDGGNAVVGEGSNGAGDWFEVDAGDEWVAPVCGGLDLGLITGVAFGDNNGSGALDGSETPMAGLTLILTPSRSDLQPRTVVTGEDGAFAFADLRPDSYTLTVVCPEGYVLSSMADVTLGLVHGVAEQTITVKVGMGSEWTEQMIGCVTPASYSGSAWLDENLNGLCDKDERPAAGEKLVMSNQITGEWIADIVTDEQGAFTVEGLAPGTYTLTFALAEDVTTSGAGDTTFAVDGAKLVMKDIVILEGSHDTGALLGLVRETTIAGRVWLDSDGETVPVEGAEVTLHGGSEDVSLVTGADGSYTFDGLMPGEYRLSIVLPEDYAALEPGDRRLADGSLVTILAVNAANTGESGTIVLEMAQHQLTLDIGSVLPGRMGDFCWLDLNGNGLQDGGEGGVPGVQIDLVRNGEIVASTVSDQYGYYVFEELYPGEYTIHVTAPAEIVPTVVRTDLPMIVSVLGADGISAVIPVDSDGVNYNADLGFVLVDPKKYPAGYGEGAGQIWSFDD